MAGGDRHPQQLRRFEVVTAQSTTGSGTGCKAEIQGLLEEQSRKGSQLFCHWLFFNNFALRGAQESESRQLIKGNFENFFLYQAPPPPQLPRCSERTGRGGGWCRGSSPEAGRRVGNSIPRPSFDLPPHPPHRRPAAVGPRHPAVCSPCRRDPPTPHSLRVSGGGKRWAAAASRPSPAARGGRGRPRLAGFGWPRRGPRKLARQEGGAEGGSRSRRSQRLLLLLRPGPGGARRGEERQRRGPMRRPGRRSPPPGPSTTTTTSRRR